MLSHLKSLVCWLSLLFLMCIIHESGRTVADIVLIIRWLPLLFSTSIYFYFHFFLYHFSLYSFFLHFLCLHSVHAISSISLSRFDRLS